MAAIKQILSSFMHVGAIWIALAIAIIVGLIYLVQTKRNVGK